MSTQAQAAPSSGEMMLKYKPLGESTEITLTIDRTRRFLANPTKSGKLPSDEEIVKFMMLCRSQELNPWAGDAYLVGYDSHDGPSFSLIASHQSILKRAEACPSFDGMESGVMIQGAVKDDPIFRKGDYFGDGEILLGGWARCYRSDQSHPSYDAINLRTFNTGRSRWKKDPGGMIVKVAEASALRKAFPTQIGGLYVGEEMESTRAAEPDSDPTAKPEGVMDQFAPAVPVETAVTEVHPSEAEKEIDNEREYKVDQFADEIRHALAVDVVDALAREIEASDLVEEDKRLLIMLADEKKSAVAGV